MKYSKEIRDAVKYLKSKGGACDWQDMTAEMSEGMLEASIFGLVNSDIETETWSLPVDV